MHARERRELNERLEKYSAKEQKKLFRRAEAMRRDAMQATPTFLGARKRRNVSREEEVDRFLLRILRDLDAASDGQHDFSPDGADGPRGIVSSLAAGLCHVHLDGELVLCELAGDIAERQKEAIATGDVVVLSPRDEGRPVVVAVEQRTSTLSRPDPNQPEIRRVIAANVDIVVIVASAKSPPLKLRLVDRYLVAIQRGGAEAVICVNKLDLLDDAEQAELLELLEPYRSVGVDTLVTSAEHGRGVDELRALLSGKTCVFAGQSGVGKSSLINAVAPGLELRTGAVREADGKGKHTTTASRLIELDDGTRIIDTPGIRSFGLWRLTPEELRWYFPEFEQYELDCRFHNCTHDHEPGCAVKMAVDLGDVPQARYDSYLRLLASLTDPF